MTNVLTAEQIAAYRHDGFQFPLAGIGAEHARRARADLEAYEADMGGKLTEIDRAARYKLHVKLPWAHGIVTHPAVLDAVEAVIGPDILVWTSTFFIKEPKTPAVTLWHQDATYFGLRPHEHITAWVALSDASAVSGCMTFIPEGGAPRLYHHKANADPNSMNGGGQTIVEEFDRGSGVRGMLHAGEFSLHHTLCIHSSPPNESDDRRIGLGISYIPASTRHIGTTRQRAMLVRGEDRYGHFELEPHPGADTTANQTEYDRSIASYNTGYAEQIAWHEAGRVRS
ncbi:MAG: phytanoyl-CoA dioxygenase family protein [Proteobacteria bacterium]|nr:phytanoyl-CoA dioxygenase family protein [Pseudomonadota bacterium]